MHEAVWGCAFLVGPGLGGALIAWVGAVNALWVTAVGFTFSAIMIAMLRLANTEPPKPVEEPAGMWQDTRAGLRFVWRDPSLLSLTAMTAALVSVYLPVEGVLLPVYFETQDQPGRLGLIVMAVSAGGVTGALGYGMFGLRFRRSLAFASRCS